MSEELKPCPFCGKAGALTTIGNYWKVACISCQSEGPSSVNREYAVEWWNTRHAATELLAKSEKARERMREALEAFDNAAKGSVTIMGFAGKAVKLLPKARAALAAEKE